MLIAVPLAVGLLLTAAHYIRHWRFTFDDAAISFTFAQHWANGFGLGMFDPRGQLVEGYTHFLWIVILAAGVKLGVSALFTAKVAGLVFALGSVGLVQAILLRLGARPWILYGTLLLPLSFSWIIWSGAGLENALLGFLVLLAVERLLAEDLHPQRLPWGSAVALSLTAMTRPDALVYLGPAFAFKIIQLALNRSQMRMRLRSLALWIGIVALLVGAYQLWHLWYFRYPFPNTVYAKAGFLTLQRALVELTAPASSGWHYVRRYFQETRALALLPLVLLGAIVCLFDRARLLLLMAPCTLLLPILTPDWMPYFRFLYPWILLSVLLTLLAVERLVGPALRQPTSHLRLALAVAVFLLVAHGAYRFAHAGLRASQAAHASNYAGEVTMQHVTASYVVLPALTKELGLHDPLSAIPDVGGPSYELGLRILDLGRLTDVHLAHSGYDPRIVEQYLFRERLPELIATHSSWSDRTGILKMDPTWCRYIPFLFVPSERYIVLVRRDLVVAPPPAASRSVVLAEGLELVGIVAPVAVSPEATGVGVDLYWKKTRPLPADLGLIVRLVDATGRVLDTRAGPLGYSWYRTSQWPLGEAIRQRLDLPKPPADGTYHLEIGAGHGSGAGGSTRVVTWPLRVDRAAASAFAAEQSAIADAELRRGAYEEAVRRVDLARSALPTDSGLGGLVRDHRRAAAGALRGVAESRLTGGDLSGTLQAIRRAEPFRDAPIQSTEWRHLSKQLLRRASAPQTSMEEAYVAAWGAAIADPSYGAAIRALEETRRNFLARSGGPMPRSVCP